ncbi:MAG: NADH-quinone oxidoreductase subunit NuoN [Alphaproteobacteria bacterium]|nr:NADH-quinone oxidoreductase subunit NuoN [Alphaproteobacteria bacterium]
MNYSVIPILPELILLAAILPLLICGAVIEKRATKGAMAFSLIAMLASASIIIFAPVEGILLRDMLVVDSFGRFVKLALLAASGLSILLAWNYLEKSEINQPEYPILILFATVGMMLMVSAHDFLALYVGLEMQSLSLCALVAFNRKKAASSEAGLKYFMLGALSSGIMLYGISLLYGYAGTTGFAGLEKALSAESPPIGVILAMAFICSAFAFKVSAVPFHIWMPDVYEGAPTPVTAFLDVAPKLAALAIFARVLIEAMLPLEHQWTQIIILLSAASMLVGGIAGCAQKNIKRLMDYSAITNIGFMLMALAIGGDVGIQTMLVFAVIYLVNTIGAFSVIICLRRNGKEVDGIGDFAGLSKTHPIQALAMAIFLLSLIGVPPLAGFFGKYFVLLAAIQHGLMPLAIIGVLASVISAYYYVHIIKLMYFNKSESLAIDPVPDLTLQIVTITAALAILLFVVDPSPLLESALEAVRGMSHT